ncbi:7226_t:CDS:2 [Dentiscutata erythropus]|uniref:7226_t:CDS:1 n=1 Tax=Dentiscutata erythropus TaxID=1348616 RepID=A0A9N9I9Y7_9GLOM|nr:7226_t:CDS:2 [Dentiscutata erythropus]
MDASFFVARTVWNKGDYTTRCIRKWGDSYIESGELFSYHQGKHKKVIGLLENEVFLNGCREWLQKQSLEFCSSKALKMHIEEVLLPKIKNAKNIISEKMCRIYMHALGYKMYMKDFVDDILEIVIEPELESDERELVQVTHDECHFYANDGQLKFGPEKMKIFYVQNTWGVP